MKNNVHKFTVAADIAAAAITSNGVRFFFDNGHGDGFFDVIVKEKTDSHYANDSIYRGLFEVGKGSSASLMSYDCGGVPVYTFGYGRWFVYAARDTCTITITHVDDHVSLIEKDMP